MKGHPQTTMTTRPASDIVSKKEPESLTFLYSVQGKPSKDEMSKMTRFKMHDPDVEGIVRIEKENVGCIIRGCSTSCPSIDKYKAHLKNVHGIRNSHTSGSKIDCPVPGCPKKLREGSMMRHIILFHMNAIRVACPHCLTSYTRIETLRAHLDKKHGGSVS